MGHDSRTGMLRAWLRIPVRAHLARTRRLDTLVNGAPLGANTLDARGMSDSRVTGQVKLGRQQV